MKVVFQRKDAKGAKGKTKNQKPETRNQKRIRLGVKEGG